MKSPDVTRLDAKISATAEAGAKEVGIQSSGLDLVNWEPATPEGAHQPGHSLVHQGLAAAEDEDIIDVGGNSHGTLFDNVNPRMTILSGLIQRAAVVRKH
eukprot:436812-Pyramimonas_sp.AAC.1